MKQIVATTHNVNTLLIGKITKRAKLFVNKKNLIFVTNSNQLPNGYLAIISSNDTLQSNFNKNIIIVKDISELNENDIVTVDSNGIISVIFDSTSKHNAIFITEQCNSNCIMCPQPPIRIEDDRLQLNLKFISLLDKNIKTIGITGGEPTLIGNKLFEIFSAIHNSIPKASITILTNGIKFEKYEYTEQFVNSLKQEIVVDIPLYSDIDSIHNEIVRTNTFHKTVKGIYNLAKFNIKIGIRIVVHKLNYDRLPELSEFIYSNFPFVYHIAFMQMEPIGFAKDNLSDLWIDPLDYNDKLEKAVLNLHYREMNVSIYNTQLCILPKTIKRFAVQSISDWKNIYIDECENCISKTECPGFFASSKEIHSRGISAIKDLQAKDA